jgi:hypothetical protein
LFTLDQIVPWGRTFDEYRLMFALTERECGLRLLGCADGPASFNAIATRQHISVCSCDPLYRFSAGEIRDRVAATQDTVMEQFRRNADQFLWTTISSPTHLRELRLGAMNQFLADYPAGKAEGRYVAAELPTLPFGTRSFDLVLCSHFLFLYSDHLGEAFHRAAVRELCRVADECRIFPLVALPGHRSPWVDPVLRTVAALGLTASIETVPYEFSRGANQMMRIRRASASTTSLAQRPVCP